MNDTISINVESHFNLGDSARRHRDPNQIELSQKFVIGRHFPFSLEDANGHGGLIVLGRREDLAFLRWDSGVALDQLCKYATKGLDTEGERRNIEEQRIRDLTLHDRILNR